jgi:hypothetical protein
MYSRTSLFSSIFLNSKKLCQFYFDFNSQNLQENIFKRDLKMSSKDKKKSKRDSIAEEKERDKNNLNLEICDQLKSIYIFLLNFLSIIVFFCQNWLNMNNILMLIDLKQMHIEKQQIY